MVDIEWCGKVGAFDTWSTIALIPDLWWYGKQQAHARVSDRAVVLIAGGTRLQPVYGAKGADVGRGWSDQGFVVYSRTGGGAEFGCCQVYISHLKSPPL